MEREDSKILHVPKTKEELRDLIEADVPGDQIDVSNITDMSHLFSNSPYNHPIGSWDVSHVKSMKYMFYESQYNHPLDSWNVSQVINMDYMFKDSKIDIGPISRKTWKKKWEAWLNQA